MDTNKILIYSAEEVAHSQFSNIFSTGNYSIGDRKEIVESLFSFCGFGEITLANMNETGGMMDTKFDHYAIVWKSKFGDRTEKQPGASLFTLGFLIGALEAIYDQPMGELDGEQMSCITKGDQQCTFVVYKTIETRNSTKSPGEGKYQEFENLPKPIGTDVTYDGIREALGGMPLEGDETGMINAFGVYLTRHYANYYCLVSHKLIEALVAKLGDGGLAIGEELLVEAGHVCAFNTFGGIMLSDEWNALIKPMLKDRDDWTHGILACINALGWGRWEGTKINAGGEFEFEIVSSYESNSFLSLNTTKSNQYNFLARGGTAGICNLLYQGDITKAPELNNSFYTKIFKSKGRFSSKPKDGRTEGSEVDSFKVVRSA